MHSILWIVLDVVMGVQMKAEIAHCLQHDLLRNYKKCDRCTSVGSVSIYHYRTCFVPSCSFFFCNILKARLNKQRY